MHVFDVFQGDVGPPGPPGAEGPQGPAVRIMTDCFLVRYFLLPAVCLLEKFRFCCCEKNTCSEHIGLNRVQARVDELTVILFVRVLLVIKDYLESQESLARG